MGNGRTLGWGTGAALVFQERKTGENGLSKCPGGWHQRKIGGWCVFEKEAAAHAVPGRFRGPGSIRRKAQPCHPVLLLLLPHWDTVQQ